MIIDREAMNRQLVDLCCSEPVTRVTDHEEYIAVFTDDAVAHIWADGSVTWESGGSR